MVRINLALAFQRQEKHYNLRHRDWRPQIGDLAWKRSHSLSNKNNAFNAKLAPKYIRSLEVRRVISPVIFDIWSRQGKWYRSVHIQDLKDNPVDQGNERTDDEAEENKNDEKVDRLNQQLSGINTGLGSRKITLVSGMETDILS